MDIVRPKSKQPIPSHAKRVFKGVMFDVYQWEQEMYDGSRTMFEKLKRPDTVTVFPVLPDGKIILLEQEQPGKEPFMGAAGGRIEEGEDPETAARRELLEETGYAAETLVLIDARHVTSKIDWVVYTFVAKGLKKVSEATPDAGEKIKLKEVTFDELLEMGVEKNFVEKELLAEFLTAKYNQAKRAELKKLFSPV